MSNDLNLTALQVEEALSRPPETNENGEVICQICDRPLPRKGSLGVHQLVHRRAVGLAPPSVSGTSEAAPKMVVCRYEGCDEMMIRTSLRSHVQGKHGMDKNEASFYMRQRRDEDMAELEKPKTKPPVTPVMNEKVLESVKVSTPNANVGDTITTNGDEYRSQFTDLTAAELVQGILSSVRSDGRIPITILPDVIDLIAHVEAVLVELDEYAEGEASD